MPKFSKEKKPEKAQKNSISQALVDDYKEYVGEIGKGEIGRLEFAADENMAGGRKALVEAGVQLRRWVKVRKPRDADNVLLVERITKQEFDAARAKAAARGAKLKGQPRPKAKAKAKPKAKKRK
ncbi:MAG: hypothetical protein GKR89_16450 [Candidatus Latescibacteria bacterium]|nr:hypothetical protein [Candidatus Latescibacterota bacterium]